MIPGIVGDHDGDDNHPVVIREFFSTASIIWEFGLAGALLVAMTIGFSRIVVAGGVTQAPEAQALTDPSVVPETLHQVPIEAIGHLQRAVELAPRSSEYCFNLGRTLSASGRFQDALPQFEAAANLTANGDATILQSLADTHAATGQYQRAVITAQQALQLAVLQKRDNLAVGLRGKITLYRQRTP